MTVKEFLEICEYVQYNPNGTYVSFDTAYDTSIMHWVGVERYCPKDENGQEIVLERFSNNSYIVKTEYYNVICCFDLGDDYTEYYHSIPHIRQHLNDMLTNGELTEDDELYVMHGQHIEDGFKNLYELISINNGYGGEPTVVHCVDIEKPQQNKKYK